MSPICRRSMRTASGGASWRRAYPNWPRYPGYRLPLRGDDWVGDLEDPDQPKRSVENEALANFRFVAPGYWKAMAVPLKMGRFLDQTDKDRPTAVISERAAQYLCLSGPRSVP